MAHENAGLDENAKWVMMGVTNDASLYRTMLRVDPTTKRLLVDAAISLDASDIQIGAVELKNGTDDTRATILDYTNSNPLAVRLTNTDGDYVAAGAGTQYATNVAYADANIGNLSLTIRDDALSTLTEADGDYSGLRVTSVGRLWASVVVDTALPAGTNAIGKLAANSGVDIGDVDVTSVTLGTYAVDDSAMPATPQTLPVSAEYRLAATTYTDGDVTVLQSDENGNLKVTLANQLAGEDLTDNLIKVGGNIVHDSADAGNPVKVGGKAASSEPSAVTAGDRVNAYFDTTGHQHVKVDAIAAGVNNIGDVDVASVVPGTGATNLGKAEDAAHTTGDVGVMALGVRNTGLSELAGTQGDYTPIATSGIGSVYTTIVSSGGDDITNASGLLVQESGAAGTSLALIDDVIYVDDADWTADTSKHALVGGVTQATPSANTDGDVTPLITNTLRELRVAIPESDLAAAATTHVKKYYTNSGAVTDGIVWSSAAGKRWYVTDIFINVSAAATVTLEDDLAAGDAVVWKAELAANSGWSHHFGTPLFSGEDAADLLVTTTAGNIYITVTGYEI